ncbi:MAG: CCC motif membrane protein [Gelidibacter sp.]|uniref:CCC motif membrane protein n=1 Tax=Gelidibacter sp. TaxID=2018083 RepID=UPI0032670F09
MEKQQLPNATLILVFGILSIVTCCCYGIIGLPLGIIAIVLANKATALYATNPELYTGFQNVKTGKILAIIGVILNAIFLITVIWMYVSLGTEGIQDMQEQWMKGLNEGVVE